MVCSMNVVKSRRDRAVRPRVSPLLRTGAERPAPAGDGGLAVGTCRVGNQQHGGKTDRHDAVSIGLAALESAAVLAAARDDVTVSLRLLCDRRVTGRRRRLHLPHRRTAHPRPHQHPGHPPEGVPAFVVLGWTDNRLVGIEILDASTRLHPDLLEEAETLS